MIKSKWEEILTSLYPFMMNPVQIDGVKITLMDALAANHGSGWIVQTHRHPWFEFNFVSDGFFFTAVDGVEFKTSQNQFFLIPPGCRHSHRNCDTADDDGFCLRFQLEFAGRPSPEAVVSGFTGQLIETLSAARPCSFEDELVNRLVSSLSPGQSAAAPLIFSRFIFDLFHLWQGENKEKQPVTKRENTLVSQAVYYMTQYYAHDISVIEIANALNISYRSLARVFKKYSSSTVVEKLNDIRIEEAKKRLRETDKTMRQIALEVGFENEYYFSTAFRTRTLATPSEFRKKLRNSEGAGKLQE